MGTDWVIHIVDTYWVIHYVKEEGQMEYLRLLSTLHATRIISKIMTPTALTCPLEFIKSFTGILADYKLVFFNRFTIRVWIAMFFYVRDWELCEIGHLRQEQFSSLCLTSFSVLSSCIVVAEFPQFPSRPLKQNRLTYF